LSDYHATADPMPSLFAECLLDHLRLLPCYAGWPLGALLDSREGFNSFVSEQWGFYVQQQTGEPLSDGRAPYLLRFEENPPLQDVVSRLVRQGALSPVEVRRPGRLPAWARPAILKTGEDRRPRRAAVLLADLAGLLQRPAEELRWEEWQRIALYWAELTVLRYDPEMRMAPDQKSDVLAVQERLDERFIAWLSRRYASLGGLRLPVPHHVFHVPHYLAYQRRQAQADRVALLVLDGLALADWFLLGPSWTARHPGWRLKTQALLAQVPTITAISRQALISGRRPAEFAMSLDTNRGEAGQWTAFWVREGLPPEACGYARLGPGSVGEVDLRVRALCLVEDSIDRMLHGA
ncbi:MAG: PglZ domain-containing protein, partial [bacterium]|nr:PglZ domain-containing protein [bacterium]